MWHERRKQGERYHLSPIQAELDELKLYKQWRRLNWLAGCQTWNISRKVSRSELAETALIESFLSAGSFMPESAPKNCGWRGFMIPVSPKIASPNYPSPIYDAPVEVVAACFRSSCSVGAGWMCSCLTWVGTE